MPGSISLPEIEPHLPVVVQNAEEEESEGVRQPRFVDEYLNSLHIRDFVGHTEKVHSVAWNCNGHRLASGSVDHSVRIWDLEPSTSKITSTEFKGHTESVDNVAWDPTHPDIFTSVSSDKSVRLWDIRTGTCQREVELTAENINVAYRPNASEIAVGNNVDELAIVDAGTFTVLFTKSYKYEVNEISWDHTGNVFFVTTGTGTIEVLDYPTLSPVHMIQAHSAGVYCLAMDPLRRFFAAGSADSVVSLWDFDSLLCAGSFAELEWPVRTISFSSDGEYIASGSEDPFIDIAEVETGDSIHQLPVKFPMNSVAWNPSRLLLAYAADDDGSAGGNPGTFQVFGFDSPDNAQAVL